MRRLGTLEDERGASAVLVAILLSALIGFTALAVDVGTLYAERAQLQNGADAAALAVAKACAADAASCSSSGQAVRASAFSGGSMNDGNAVTAVDSPVMPTPTTSGKVTVHTETPDLAHPFAAAIGFDATDVPAQATAEWGYVGGGEFIPLAIAECEIERGIADAGSIGTPFKLLTDATPSGGGGGGAGGGGAGGGGAPSTPDPCDDADYPGGFSWLTDDNCRITLNPDNIVPGENGNNTGGTGCGTSFLNDLLDETVLVALYDEVTGLSGTGSHGEYTISKFAAFHITGYSAVMPSGGATTEYIGSPYDASPYKFTGSERGLQGYFIEYVSVAEALLLTSVGSPSDPMFVRLID
ncbi:Flp pilus assembly protein TadG [Agromyces ramosus]|uniref:Flp pilus assembly protein TadG n=1 Tax=Agromyces ramosus TaxID=33879 RepID=A0A4Q7ML27_9MICO|nr:pilus assembly protein TadG-related protein [Agromyces ramosus]RZS68637.1 Flp pilus assembly protein TadG [Agromyces ramosus]